MFSLFIYVFSTAVMNTYILRTIIPICMFFLFFFILDVCVRQIFLVLNTVNHFN